MGNMGHGSDSFDPKPNTYSQFTLVTHFCASSFISQETVKCDSSVNWNIAVGRRKF